MKLSRLFLLAILLPALLNGCAYLYSRSDNVPAKIDELIKQDEYELALETIRHIKKDHPQYKQIMHKREHVLTATKSFETNVLMQGERLTEQELWHEAHRVYEYGVEKLPNSKKLQFAHKEFLHKRNQHLKQLELKLLVSKGKSLSQSAEARKEIARVFPESKQATSELQKHYEEVELTAEKLVACSEDAMSVDDLSLAKECLTLAKHLNPPVALAKRITRLEKAYKKATRVNAKKNAPSINKLQQALDKATTSKELANIQLQVQQIYKQNKSDPKFKNLKNELDSKVNKAVNIGIQAGREFYSKGKIREALDIWQEARLLDPDNKKLKDYIQRAERVINKIESLSNKKNNNAPKKEGS